MYNIIYVHTSTDIYFVKHFIFISLCSSLAKLIFFFIDHLIRELSKPLIESIHTLIANSFDYDVLRCPDQEAEMSRNS